MKQTKIFLSVIAVASFGLIIGVNPACTKDKAPPSLSLVCPDTVSFSMQILPLIQTHCASCHSPGAGSSPTLSSHADISASADLIHSTLRGTPQLMPQGGPALPDSLIHQFNCWILQGKQNN